MAHTIYGQSTIIISKGSDVQNPYVATTLDEFKSYLTNENVGAFVKYAPQCGASTPVNPIAVGDTITQLYCKEDVEPDFTKFTGSYVDMGENASAYFLLSVSDGPVMYIVRFNKDTAYSIDGKEITFTQEQYYITVKDTTLWISSELAQKALGVTGGWQDTSPFVLESSFVVSEIFDQDIWGAYISKDGQWTSGSESSEYKPGIYQVTSEDNAVLYQVLPVLTNEGTAEDLAKGKQLINSNGEVVEGTKTQDDAQNPIVATSEAQMSTLLTADNVGKFVTFNDGGSADYTPIEENTAVSTLYFDTTSEPDFDEILDSVSDSFKLTSDGYTYAYLAKFKSTSSSSDTRIGIILIRSVASDGTILTAIQALGSHIVYANCNNQDVYKPSDIGLSKWGWQYESTPEDWLSNYQNFVYTEVADGQDVWGKYISETTSFAAPYTSGQSYTIVDTSGELSYVPVYGLTKLTNKASAADIITGYSAYDNNGRVISGTALRNNDTKFISREIQEVTASSMRDTYKIGSYAFAGCSQLSSVEVGNNITSIREYAFLNAPSALNITWEDGSDSLRFWGHAFDGYQGSSITIPARTTSLYEDCFANTSNLKTVNISDIQKWLMISFGSATSNPLYHPQLTDGGNLVLNGTLVSKLVVPSTYYNGDVNRFCFAGCRSLTEVDLSDSIIANIDDSAFLDCANLSKITMPSSDSVTIYKDAFKGCDNLVEVEVSSFDSWVSIAKAAADNPLCHNALSHLVISGEEAPSGVINGYGAPAYTYQNSPNITKVEVNLNEAADAYEGYAPYVFRNCTGIESFTTADVGGPTVGSFGASAFEGCTGLKDIQMSTTGLTVDSIGVNCFKGCTALTNVYFEQYDSISAADSAFEGCVNIKTITAPSSSLIRAIPKNSVVSVIRRLPNVGTNIVGRLSISAAECEGASVLEKYVWQSSGTYGVAKIGARAFYGCASLTRFNRFDALTNIVYLPKATASEFISYIEDSAFEGCSSLTDLGFFYEGDKYAPRFGSKALHIGTTTNKAIIRMSCNSVPEIQSDTFDTTKLEKIIVPAGMKASYIANANWKALEDYIEEAAS